MVREYTGLLELDDITLEFTPDGLEEVVAFAVNREVGARGLRAILEEVLSEVMFEAPERRGSTVEIDAEMVRSQLEGVEADDLILTA